MSYQQQRATSHCNRSLRTFTKLLGAAIFATTIWAQAQTFTVLHNFTGGLDGANPYTGLTMDRSGTSTAPRRTAVPRVTIAMWSAAVAPSSSWPVRAQA